MFSNGGSHELLKLSWTGALVRVHRWHQGQGRGATPPCSCCCPWSQPRDTCNFSPHCFKEGLFTVEKSQTFPANKWRIQPLSGSHGGVRHSCAQPGSWAKGFKAVGLPASLKRLSKGSVKQLKRFIKFGRKLQNSKKGYLMCIKWFCHWFSLHSIPADSTKV